MIKRRSSHRKTRRQNFHITRLFPNMVTLLALCAGLSAVRAALQERWEIAVGFILAAAVLDAVDGRLARMLDSASEFGAQLDSLADIINFGVAPPLILYLWITQEFTTFGWPLVLFFTICCALRLARFNTALVEEKPRYSDRYFMGIPAPAGALLALFPMALTFEFGDITVLEWNGNDYFPHATALFAAFIGAGMISRIPTYSLKKVAIKRQWVAAFMLGFGSLVIGLIQEPWLTVCIIGAIYALSLPVSIILGRPQR